MKLQEIVDALRAVRDVETNHKGLLALRRQLHRSRPASDQLLCAYLQQSPACSELQAIWDVQVTAKEPKVTLELLGCLAALLAYSPSSSCHAAARQRITTGLDLLAGAILQRRLKQVYFLLSSNNRQRSNAALALLTALAGRGGSTLRELCAAFDFSLSVLPKLARPPRLAGNGGGLQESGGLAGKGGGEGQQQQQQVPAQWEMWASPALGRRPSRAVFVEWAAAGVKPAADPQQQQQQQQYTQQQLRLLQCQVCGVLRCYARWLPEAVAEGHADLAKLLLQGQDLLSAPVDVQQAALDMQA
ncbi:hypothetical protein OEZ86_004035 [Tetradesmus obliquus]|nr:hypothetical protein OEZ86_004035 [Tetradesmus obliquus]